ncbi:hypothetical protein ACJMK2_005564 [Sinanodonta woodiana]|uniref:Uncharacterized protein n=1 Tax=Sinanodonta woodiana TaxID=1069815 RepID=A0ABD3VQX5_SINWO
MVLSAVVDLPIQTLYPRMNGPLDKTHEVLTKLFSTADIINNALVTILWRKIGPKSGNIWTANHFVPALKNICGQVNNEQFQPPEISTPIVSNKRKFSFEVTDNMEKDLKITRTEKSASSMTLSETIHSFSIENDFIVDQASDQSITNDDSVMSTEENGYNTGDKFENDVKPAYFPVPKNVTQLTPGQWHSGQEAYKWIAKKEYVHSEVPPGNKSNCFLLSE